MQFLTLLQISRYVTRNAEHIELLHNSTELLVPHPKLPNYFSLRSAIEVLPVRIADKPRYKISSGVSCNYYNYKYSLNAIPVDESNTLPNQIMRLLEDSGIYLFGELSGYVHPNYHEKSKYYMSAHPDKIRELRERQQAIYNDVKLYLRPIYVGHDDSRYLTLQRFLDDSTQLHHEVLSVLAPFRLAKDYVPEYDYETLIYTKVSNLFIREADLLPKYRN